MNRRIGETGKRGNGEIGIAGVSYHRFSDSPFLRIVPVLLILMGCVPAELLPPGSLPAGPPSGDVHTQSGSNLPPVPAFPDLDPGATEIRTLHFTLRGYTNDELQPIGTMVETLYSKIGADTGLYSFLASGSYRMVVYKDQSEYFRKTQQAAWSRSVTVGSTIYTYPGADLEPVLAHELTHVIFFAYMGEKVQPYRWINEGLAMYEEMAKVPEGDRSTYFTQMRERLRTGKMAFSYMTFFVPANEERRRVDIWYMQVQSVVTFLLAQGSSLNFAAFLNDLRSDRDIDRALQSNYPGKFNSLTDLENAWKNTV